MSASWFSKLFGFNEQDLDYSQVKTKFTITDTTITSVINLQTYKIGTFETPTLKELRAKSQFVPTTSPNRIHHIASNDVFMLHTIDENKHALFMAASQFNCLEFLYPYSIPEHGVTGYINDHTQGPACALAGAPATIYRNYWVNQGKHEQLNCLRQVECVLENDKNKYFKVPFFII